ncbi:hypothetical protein SynWH8103_00605 [Synechococcus sp. WH 8103]|nr:hypothetical protein SynWH8103_00605 [Synechococcus sp. WH 8103]
MDGGSQEPKRPLDLPVNQADRENRLFHSRMPSDASTTTPCGKAVHKQGVPGGRNQSASIDQSR